MTQSTLTDVDVVVLGLGPGGEACATKLADAGLSVVAVEKNLVGGECPYYGCVPTKMMVRAAEVLAESRRVPQLAGDSTTSPDWAPVARRIRSDATADWDDTEAVERLEKAGATVLRAAGRVIGPRQVEAGGQIFRAARGVVLNTGTDPGAPPVDGLAQTPYWTNRDAVKVTELPPSLVVLGGGAIGCEFAQVFARFGVQVTVIEAAERILSPEEPESSRVLTEALTRDGVRVVAGARVGAVSHADGRFRLSVEGEEVTAEKLLVAAGRTPQIADVGLDSVGLDGSAKALKTDERLRVLRDGEPVEGLWAVGDIVGEGAYTHVSMYQSAIVIRDILGQEGPPADYRAVPHVTFTDPEVGSVGMTEHQAREAGRDVQIGFATLPESARGRLHGVGNEGFVKLIVDGEELLGATSVGPTGGEVLAMLTTAIHGRVPVSALESMIFAYPTFHGAVRDALTDLRRRGADG